MQNETIVGNGLFQILKGAFLALAFSFLATVVFASVIRFAPVPEKAIYPVNQTVKVLAIAIGVFAFVRGEKGFLKGVAIALIFTALSYLAFSAIGGDFSLSWLMLVELVIAVLAGVICGAVAENIRRS